ncbi:MAG: TlpA family protein disulfide reductase, partial [Oscillospiraceae bacterium]|nr:TlpA family protein disulfide reductase [Oscillospiraceae bacterium]
MKQKSQTSGKGPFVALALTLAALLILGGGAYRVLSQRFAPEDTPLPAQSPPAASAERADVEAEPEIEAESEPVEEDAHTVWAQDFTVLDGEDNPVRLVDQLENGPVIVNFWATWCPPCRAELPHFDAAWQEYGDRITFMMVDLCDGYQETRETAADFLTENGYSFPVYYDVTGETVSAYGLSAIPVTVAISGEGEVLRMQVGSMTESALQDMIALLLD